MTAAPRAHARGRARGGGERGALAIVLHTHMPYVEGFGTWPFGEEWLWEAIAGSYLPLLDVLDAGAPLTLSLTPVLCDQLEAPGVGDRFAAFVQDVRGSTHAEDAAGLRAGGHERLARELERSWGDYRRALDGFRARGGDLLGAFAPHAQWTSSATHAVLPLLATDAGVELQVRTGVASHRRRFGGHVPGGAGAVGGAGVSDGAGGAGWRGGFWLPECAYASWLERTLEEAGASAVCVELTNRLGLGAREHLRPLVTDSGVLLAPIDRTTMSLVWSDGGYPAASRYRDYHHHTVHHHNPWSNDGGAYDHAAACALAAEHARDFVERTRARLREAHARGAGDDPLPGGGLVVCALDTELLGHWWYEGVVWLRAVVEECARQGLELVRMDDALERIGADAAPVAALDGPPVGEQPCTWGRDGDLSTWSGPAVADMAFAARAAELEVLGFAAKAPPTAARELLALQASDWPFMVAREIAVPYARERFAGHRRALAAALAGETRAAEAGLRNLAVDARPV